MKEVTAIDVYGKVLDLHAEVAALHVLGTRVFWVLCILCLLVVLLIAATFIVFSRLVEKLMDFTLRADKILSLQEKHVQISDLRGDRIERATTEAASAAAAAATTVVAAVEATNAKIDEVPPRVMEEARKSSGGESGIFPQ